MTGNEYADLIAAYLTKNYRHRGLRVYREVSLGKTIIGKNRRVDILAVHDETQRALAVECKYQTVAGTADEKLPYAIQDLEALSIPATIAYAGEGFSARRAPHAPGLTDRGVLHARVRSRRYSAHPRTRSSRGHHLSLVGSRAQTEAAF